MTPKRELLNLIVDELNLDTRDPFTLVLANALALSDMVDELRAELAATTEPLNVHSEEEACRNLAQRMIGQWSGRGEQLVAFLRLLHRTYLPLARTSAIDECVGVLEQMLPLRTAVGLQLQRDTLENAMLLLRLLKGTA
jgi:hypothetical protein